MKTTVQCAWIFQVVNYIVVFMASVSTCNAAFQAGAAKFDITPTQLPIRTAGSLTLTIVDKIRDPLFARAMVIADGKTKVVVATVDSCMIGREELDAAKQMASPTTGIPTENMLVSATHSHTAPAVYGCHGNEPEIAYRQWMIGRIAEAIITANQSLQPARVGWGKRDLPDFVHCRRWLMKPGTALHVDPDFTGAATNLAMMNPGASNTNRISMTGPVDPTVTVLSIQTKDGKPLALLANYSSHYGGSPGNMISADYFGEFCNMIAAELKASDLNPGFVALISNATSGDANWFDLSQTNRKTSSTDIASGVTATVVKILKEVVYQDTVPVISTEKIISLGVRHPSAENVQKARQYLETRVGSRPTQSWEENYARETVFLGEWPAKKQIKLQAIRIGDFGIGAIPCEVFGSTGLNIKKASPFPVTMVISLANGASGYLPPADQFKYGGYTTWRARTSYLETDAESQIAQNIIDLLKSVHVR